MMRPTRLLAWQCLALALLALGCGAGTPAPASFSPTPMAERPGEAHLKDIVQLTRGAGENAEAYFSPDGEQLILQSNRPPFDCDQIYRMPSDGSAPPELVSTGKGRTTCAFFLPDGDRILYSSTHLGGTACPPVPDHSQGYVWPIYAAYDVFVADADGSNPRRITRTEGYDAEATVCPHDGSIVFTSMRDGDLELYRMDSNGQHVRRLTHAPGYDGGAFFSADCSQIVWRASRPQAEQLEDYRALLAQGLVRPTKLELWVANADGSNPKQITYLDAASFAPYFYPSGERILFSSNYGDARGREFELWAVDTTGARLERITHSEGFDGFPMFSPDGERLAFASNRNQAEPGQTDVYVARWQALAEPPIVPRAADRIMDDIRWLADDARQGRGIGTEGLEQAAAWLERRYRALGLEPAGGDSFRHSFEVTVAVRRGEGTSLGIDGRAIDAEDFMPMGFSASGTAQGRIVAAGYGITAEGIRDDYEGVDAEGKIVVVRRFTPRGPEFSDDRRKRRYSDLRYKAYNAREHGAAGLIVVDAPAGEPVEEAPLPSLSIDRAGDAGIPVVVVKRATGERLLSGRHRARLRVQLERERKQAHNLVAKITAASSSKQPGAIVIGAHYDHLGLGGEGSLATAHGHRQVEPAIHNGADDNASGTAVLLEVARQLAERRDELGRDVILAAFSAEEVGIVGSSTFAKDPPGDLDPQDTFAMLNMDMVGRLRHNRLSVLGAESAKQWADLVTPLCESAKVRCKPSGEGFGPSDHTPFYAAGIPVLHFFTGSHRQYHRPQDDPPLINAAGAAQVARIVEALAVRLGEPDVELTYQKSAAPPPAGDARSHGASMGTMPDYTETDEPGVVLAGTRKDGPADKAGLQRGDRIVRIGDSEIRNIHDMMFVLRKAKPDETTDVVVVRNGQKHTLELTYGHRRRPLR